MYKRDINTEYIEMFNRGYSIWDIANKNKDTYKNVYESISGHRFEARLLPNHEKNRIKNLYFDGMSTVKIGEMYGINNKPIAAVLEEFGIKRNQRQFVRKYSINEEYFDIIDTPNKAYCLGFIAADGCNYVPKSTISMSLEECDKQILELICKEMNNTHPLEYIDYSNKHDFGYTYKNQYRMLIFSKHMSDSLIKLGITQNKSNKLCFPDYLNEKLLPHYIRGLFDGDGSIGYKDVDSFIRKGKRLNISITSTLNLCNSLSEYLLEKHGIHSQIREASNHNGITMSLNINKYKDIDLFLSLIYTNADIYLKRKHNIYLEYLKHKEIQLEQSL